MTLVGVSSLPDAHAASTENREGYAIGLMSGTSGDGIDVALVSFKEIVGTEFPEMHLEHFLYVPFEASQREEVFALFDPRVSADYVAWMDRRMGEWFGQASRLIMRESQLSPHAPLVIGLHGQTVCHHPDRHFTLQIGDPAIVATYTYCPVVSNFRKMDMALGGQGAPLIPYFDYAYFRSQKKSRVLLNLGGISNITLIKEGAAISELVAFDTGPGNMVIDGTLSLLSDNHFHVDEEGRLAARGHVDTQWVQSLIEKDDYFRRNPPKSTGREEYGESFLRKELGTWLAERTASGSSDITDQIMADGVASMTFFVAQTVALAIKQVIDGQFELVITGGGRHNRTLVAWIVNLVKPEKTLMSEDFGVPSDAKEAMAFALFAWQFLHHRSVNIPHATGASHAAVLGAYTPAPKR